MPPKKYPRKKPVASAKKSSNYNTKKTLQNVATEAAKFIGASTAGAAAGGSFTTLYPSQQARGVSAMYRSKIIKEHVMQKYVEDYLSGLQYLLPHANAPQLRDIVQLIADAWFKGNYEHTIQYLREKQHIPFLK